ncbi:NADPH-dependent FMN reductase [Arsenicicoccus sp. oral taxon 190]|nr:NADPH-dependent FMN reductase [Arsenicicoccus sp. oral taxon 190]
MKIGIIIGSVREGRKGSQVAQWVLEGAREHGGADVDLVDLREFDLLVLTSATVPGAANREYDDERVTRWSAAIDGYDGFIFVTPEYNHSVPGAFKNAFDSIGPEWIGKTVGFVSYGADGGVRAVEHWRTIVANFQMVDVRGQVALGLFTDFGDEGFTPLDRRPGELRTLLDQLVRLTSALRG